MGCQWERVVSPVGSVTSWRSVSVGPFVVFVCVVCVRHVVVVVDVPLCSRRELGCPEQQTRRVQYESCWRVGRGCQCDLALVLYVEWDCGVACCDCWCPCGGW